jgi:glycosyltransferase involved in cell wall biosynthesis
VSDLKPDSKVRILLIWNGFQPGIAQSVQDFIISNDCAVVSIQHPLFRTENYRRIINFKNGSTSEILKSKKSTPLVGYLRDFFWPLNLPQADIAIGFSCHLTYRLLRLRRQGKIKTVIHWNIDYVPPGMRFQSKMLDFVYRKLDKHAVENSDFHVDLTDRALKERMRSYQLLQSAKDLVVPVGINSSNFSSPARSKFLDKKIVFIGNLEQRLGTGILLETVSILRNRGIEVHLDLVGKGSDMENLKTLCRDLEIGNNVIFHGEMSPKEYMPIIKMAAVACAPYLKDPNSFSIYADPSKIKNYIEGGTPIVLSDVPEIAQKLANCGAAVIAEPNSSDFALAIEDLLQNEDRWSSAAEAVEKYAKSCDWNIVLQPLLEIIEGITKIQI